MLVANYKDLNSSKIEYLDNCPKEEISFEQNIVMLNGNIFSDNLVLPFSKAPIFSKFLNFCTFIESLILFDNIILPPTVDGQNIIYQCVQVGLNAKCLNLPENELGKIVKFPMQPLKSFNCFMNDEDNNNHCNELGDAIYDANIFRKINESDNYEEDRMNELLSKIVKHALDERVACELGVPYIQGFGISGNIHQQISHSKINMINQITPFRFSDLINKSLQIEKDELGSVGVTFDLDVPPIALYVLNQCKGDKKHLGEVILQERLRAENFRKWVSELKTELLNAKSIDKANKIKIKLEKVFNDFSNRTDSDTCQATTWSGLLSAFPKSVWDGLSKEDIDIKSLAQYFIEKPIKHIHKLIQSRNYLYLLNIKNKVRKIEEYSKLLKDTLGIELSKQDLDELKSLNEHLSMN